MMHTSIPRYDLERFGAIPRGSPRQSDLMIVAGTLTNKMAHLRKYMIRCLNLDMLYRWVAVQMGGVLPLFLFRGWGCDRIVPVDIYVPGCPPSAEALLYGIMQLQKKIRRTGTVSR